MSIFILNRFSYSPTETEGILELPNMRRLATIERPWIPDLSAPGGTREVSCVPDGTYEMVPFLRPGGSPVYQLLAPHLGVYAQPEDVPPTGGRDLILIHKGNFVQDVKGCIAPGMKRGILNERRAVMGSAAAMACILADVPYAAHTLVIRNATGAVDGSKRP